MFTRRNLRHKNFVISSLTLKTKFAGGGVNP